MDTSTTIHPFHPQAGPIFSLTYFIDMVGITGVGFVLFAYFRLQTRQWTIDDARYSAVNLAGSVLILVSLVYNFNLASFLIEIVWILISIVGLIKARKQ